MFAQLKFDAIDRRILRHLQDNSRISFTELAENVGLSTSSCLRRVRRLENDGVIRGYVALISQEKLGLTVNVFVGVKLERQTKMDLELFEKHISDCREVMECYYMSGEVDFLLRVVAKDLAAYEDFLLNKLMCIPGVATVRSNFALKQAVYRTALPLCAALGLADIAEESEPARMVADVAK